MAAPLSLATEREPGRHPGLAVPPAREGGLPSGPLRAARSPPGVPACFRRHGADHERHPGSSPVTPGGASIGRRRRPAPGTRFAATRGSRIRSTGPSMSPLARTRAGSAPRRRRELGGTTPLRPPPAAPGAHCQRRHRHQALPRRPGRGLPAHCACRAGAIRCDRPAADITGVARGHGHMIQSVLANGVPRSSEIPRGAPTSWLTTTRRRAGALKPAATTGRGTGAC